MRGVVELVHQLVRPLKARMNAMVARAVLDSVNDGSMLQAVEVTVGSFGNDDDGNDLPDKLPGEHFQPGGLTHVPLRDAEGIVLCVQGLRSHPLMLLLSNRDQRPKGLQAGETALYTAGELGGIRVLCKADGSVLLGSELAVSAVALAPLVHAAVAAALAAGADAGGPGAANFTAAASNWTAATSVPPGVGSLKVKSA